METGWRLCGGAAGDLFYGGIVAEGRRFVCWILLREDFDSGRFAGAAVYFRCFGGWEEDYLGAELLGYGRFVPGGWISVSAGMSAELFEWDRPLRLR